jgi:2-polyprenyl-3-methyl-5-hydroxy-6-metoxy-1,4-benzoquinol methylase
MNLNRLYQNRFSLKEKEKRLVLWNSLYQSFLSRFIASSDIVCDVGAGTQEFLKVTRAKKKIAVDIQYEKDTVVNGMYCYKSLKQAIGKHKHTVDTLMCSNILEHLKNREEILTFLLSIRTLLKPHGQLLIIQPTIDLVGNRYWDFFDHICPITRKSLIEALEIAGYRVDVFVPRFLPYTTKTMIPMHPIFIRLYLMIPWRLRPFAGQCFVKAIPVMATRTI